MDKSKDYNKLCIEIPIMAKAKFIRIDNDVETVREFDNSSPYEGLKDGEIIEVDCEDGQLRDYIILKTQWDFTHFGDTLVVTIVPANRTVDVQPVISLDGQIIGYMKA